MVHWLRKTTTNTLYALDFAFSVSDCISQSSPSKVTFCPQDTTMTSTPLTQSGKEDQLYLIDLGKGFHAISSTHRSPRNNSAITISVRSSKAHLPKGLT